MGLGIGEFADELPANSLEVLDGVEDSLGLVSHFSGGEHLIADSDRPPVTMEHLQMAILVRRSHQKSNRIGTQIDDAGDRGWHEGQRIDCEIFARVWSNQAQLAVGS